MSEQLQPTKLSVAPSQVWINLAADLKARVIWLLSQLAFNRVKAQSEQTNKEACDVTISSK